MGAARPDSAPEVGAVFLVQPHQLERWFLKTFDPVPSQFWMVALPGMSEGRQVPRCALVHIAPDPPRK